MDQATHTGLEPRFENGKRMIMAGFAERITPETWDKIDKLWWRFAPHIGSVPGQLGVRVAYGVVTDAGNGIEYLAGVEVSDESHLPDGFTHVRLPAQRYAVFRHERHVSKLKDMMTTIFETWLPQSGHEHARTPGAPAFFERYGEEFDPQAGTGGIEVWLPIKP
jgi:AraC family transcriptional regulator